MMNVVDLKLFLCIFLQIQWMIIFRFGFANADILYHDYFVEEDLQLFCTYESVHENETLYWIYTSYENTDKSLKIKGERHNVYTFANSSTFVLSTLEQSDFVELKKRDPSKAEAFIKMKLKVSKYPLPCYANEYNYVDTIVFLNTTVGTILHSWFVSVHTPEETEFLMTDKGQSPYAELTTNNIELTLEWSSWTACDGCSGKGERRRFGFCYAKWRKKTYQCHSPAVPHLVQALQLSRKEQIEVEVCYEPCDEKVIFTEGFQLLYLIPNEELILSCPKATTSSVIRWELNGHTLRRKDISFLYKYASEMYLQTDNKLWLMNAKSEKGTILKISCIHNRSIRYDFDVVTEPTEEDAYKTAMVNRLFWAGMTCSVQISLFICGLAVYNVYIQCSDTLLY